MERIPRFVRFQFKYLKKYIYIKAIKIEFELNLKDIKELFFERILFMNIHILIVLEKFLNSFKKICLFSLK